MLLIAFKSNEKGGQHAARRCKASSRLLADVVNSTTGRIPGRYCASVCADAYRSSHAYSTSPPASGKR